MFGLGLVLMVFGVVFNVSYAPTHGQDFAKWYFPAAERFAARQNLYVISGDVFRLREAEQGILPPIHIPANTYPPLHAALITPLLPLGLPLAQYTFMLLSLAVFSVGLWQLMKVATPWSRSARTLAIGLAMCASSVRWSSAQYQYSLAAVGLVCLVMYTELTNRRLATVVYMTLCVKFTMLLPVVAVLLFRRKIGTLVAAGALTAALNLACFAWMGFLPAVAGWRLSVDNYVVVNGLNYPSVSTFVARLNGDAARASEPPGITLYPKFDYYYYPEHTHWVLLMTALTPTFAVATTVAGVLVAGVASVLAVLGWRLRDRWNDRETVLRWFMVWSCFGMVAVTHLKYDLVVLVPVCYVAMALAAAHKDFPDRALALAAFVASFGLVARMANVWIFKLAAPLKLYWLVPFYVYIATLVFGLSLWGLARAASGVTAIPSSTKSSSSTSSLDV